MTELEALAFVDDDALQVVDLGLVHTLHAQFLGKRDPIIKFLLLECLRVDSKSLQVH